MTEDQLEQETLQWLAQVGYTVKHGLDIAPDGSTPLRSNYQQVQTLPPQNHPLRQPLPLVMEPGMPEPPKPGRLR